MQKSDEEKFVDFKQQMIDKAFKTCVPASDIAQMYVDDERFRAFYDADQPDNAEFLDEVIADALSQAFTSRSMNISGQFYAVEKLVKI